MEKWVSTTLSEFFGFEVPDELTKQFLQQRNLEDLREYAKSLLDLNDRKHQRFLQELLERQASAHKQTAGRKLIDNANQNSKSNSKKKGKNKGKECSSAQEAKKDETPQKKKTEFVNLYSEEGHNKTILLKGRHKCNCEAKTHELINNCTNCGRIVCVQEGSGPCFFCNKLVCSQKETKILSSKSRQANALFNKLMDQKPNKTTEESLKHRDKLLEYDRTCAQRTRVIDDQADYFQTHSRWSSVEERKKMQKREQEISARKHASRLEVKKITLDFTGRQAFEEDEVIDESNEEEIQEFYRSMPFCRLENYNMCPTIDFDPIYIEQNMGKSSNSQILNTYSTRSRIQDKEYLEMADSGHCLSMHQPYASLLVAGIKKHEGRTWYTSHRGRLWIAATSKIPHTEDLSNVQHFYRALKDERIKFPDQYPTSCLLGCVTVVDCLPQEEYRIAYPEIESDDPYVFICENPYVLPIKFPIQGKHKIYKLDNKIHQAAMKYLEKVMKETKDSN